MADEPLKTAVLTDVGIAKLDAAYQAGTKVTIAEMALGDSNLEYVVPDPTFTQLVNEFGRQPINEGNTSDTWINAIVYVDSTQFAGKSILEFGLYDDEGDLIVYSSYTPSVIPSVGQDYIQLEIECSVDLYNASAVTIEVTPIYPQATELERGIAKVATDEDVAAGVDDEKIVTAKKLKESYIQWAHLVGFKLTDSFAGVDRTAIALKGDGTEVTRADFPKLLQYAIDNDLLVEQALIDANPTQYAANYGTGDGSITFTLPNYGLMPYEAAAGMYSAAGTTVEDQIQNVTGYIGEIGSMQAESAIEFRDGGGAFQKIIDLRNIPNSLGAFTGKSNAGRQMSFDASRVARTGTYTRPKTHFSDVWIIHGEIA